MTWQDRFLVRRDGGSDLFVADRHAQGNITISSPDDPRVAQGTIQPNGQFTAQSVTDIFTGQLSPNGSGTATDLFQQGNCRATFAVTFTP